MATHIPFTDNYDDLSTDRGYQFKFHCQRCGNGYMSSFQQNVGGMAEGALRMAGNLFGGFLGRAADSAYEIQQAVGGPAHDGALRKAVEEIAPLFTQCKRCGTWVCETICWNGAANLCTQCAPKIDEEIRAIESEGTIAQLREKAYSGVDLTGGVQLKSAAAALNCPSCGAEVAPGKKFCAECGTNVLARPTCSSCGAEGKAGQKFCGECGGKMS
jgi:hypothetical protein